MSETFFYTSTRDPRVKFVLDDLSQEYESRYGDLFRKQQEGPPEMERYPPEAFAPPSGNFLVLLRDDVVVAAGAFMRHDEHTAEFKRIWTRRDLRRQGLARRLLVELEAQAARQGYRRVYLTTGFRQPEAVGLYLGYGYTPLFELPVDPDEVRILPFEKLIGPLSIAPSVRTGLARLPARAAERLPVDEART